MKIGIEAQRIFRPKKHGMDIYTLELIRALQRIDDKNEYVIFVKPDSDVCLNESKNMRIIQLAGKTYADWEQISLPKAISREKVDVMHFTSNTACLNIQCPFLVTIHDVIYLEDFRTAGPMNQLAGHYYYRWNVPITAPQANYVLTVSKYEKIRIQQTLNLSGNRVKVVYNAINEAFCEMEESKKTQEIKEKYNLPNQFIFFLGNQAPKKNMKRVLQAYGQYVDNEKNPLPLVIAESSSEQLLTLLAAIDRIDLFDKIVLTGYVPHSDVPYLYNFATLFLYPSLRESFGMPIIEAMACGTPVITSNTSAMPEIAGGAAILVSPTNATEIAAAMSKVLDNQLLYNQLKTKGLSRATDFSWNSTAQRTMSFYQTTLAKPAEFVSC